MRQRKKGMGRPAAVLALGMAAAMGGCAGAPSASVEPMAAAGERPHGSLVLPSAFMREMGARAGDGAVIGPGDAAYARNDDQLGERATGPFPVGVAVIHIDDTQRAIRGQPLDQVRHRTRSRSILGVR